jgi:hypothetical protein
MCYVEAKHSSSDPVSNISYGSNPKVITAKSKKTSPASEYVHTNSIICNFWNMSNRKKLKIINKTTEPNLVDYISQDR